MNLQTHINSKLWKAIESTYETENYSHAILDALHYVSDLLREKSGVDGDWQSLVGRVLGGTSPILRINKLQTETERNVQKGMEQILRGLYQGVRNPRSHEQIEDTKDTADAIIVFINYIASILDESQEPFTIQGFMFRVLDEHFVKSPRYAELLVSEIPLNQRFDTLIEIYRRKREGDGYNLEYVVKEILKHIPEDQIDDFLIVVSDELKSTTKDIDIKLTLQILSPSLWQKLNETSRLRVENILIKSLKEGNADSNGNTLDEDGALGTWARRFLPYFDLKSQAGAALLDRLQNGGYGQSYVFQFFLGVLPNVLETTYQKSRCVKLMRKAINEDYDGDFLEKLKAHYWSYPDDWREDLKDLLPESEDEIPF